MYYPSRPRSKAIATILDIAVSMLLLFLGSLFGAEEVQAHWYYWMPVGQGFYVVLYVYAEFFYQWRVNVTE